MSIQPVPPSSAPTTAGQLAARATQNDQALAAWLGDHDDRIGDLESRSGTSVAGAVDTFADLAGHEGAEDGKAFVVVDEVAMYVRDRSRPTGWVGPVPMQGSATDVAVAALVDSASSTRAALDASYGEQVTDDAVAAVVGPQTDAALATIITPPGSAARAVVDAAIDARAVRAYPNKDAMLAGSPPPTSADIHLRSFQTFNDGVRPEYAVGDSTPTGRAANYAAPLPGGRWGYPANVPMQPGYRIHPREYVSLFECAKTYVAEKSRFKWDPTRTPGILATSNIHGTNMPVTCSSFAGIVLAGIDYQDSLYAPGTTKNTRTRPWGLNFARRPGALHPFQGHRLAQYFLENDQLFLAAEDLSNIEPGDVLFFSKQQPEGAGTEDYFFNIFHVGILLSAGGAPFVVHSKSPTDPSGIMEDALDTLTTLKPQVSFFARPRFARCAVSRRLENVAVNGPTLTLASAGTTLRQSITDDMVTITFDGAQFNQGVLYTQIVGTLPRAYWPDQTQMATLLLVNGGTPTAARARVTPTGELSIYSNVSINSTALYYGSITYPTRVGHQALGFNLGPGPTTT